MVSVVRTFFLLEDIDVLDYNINIPKPTAARQAVFWIATRYELELAKAHWRDGELDYMSHRTPGVSRGKKNNTMESLITAIKTNLRNCQ